jgi:hypothetical protein
VLKFDAQSNLLWRAEVAGFAYAIAIGQDDGVLLTGSTVADPPDLLLMGLQADGSVKWSRESDLGAGDDAGFDLAEDADGSIVVTGQAGDELWVGRFEHDD